MLHSYSNPVLKSDSFNPRPISCPTSRCMIKLFPIRRHIMCCCCRVYRLEKLANKNLEIESL